MNFFKNIFKSSEKVKDEELKNQPVSLALDDSFVHNFINHGGKFLYCQNKKDITKNILQIIEENNWDTITYKNEELTQFIASIDVKTTSKYTKELPFFTACEFLIAENGSILFSSSQLEDIRLSTLSNNFIVYATTSQIVKCKDDSLTGISIKYKKNLPTNISPVKNYNLKTDADNFLNASASNSKNLYLLLFEDL